MEDFFFHTLDQLTELENEEQELLEKQQEIERLLENNKKQQDETTKELIDDGKFHFTRSKRQEIINRAVQVGISEGHVEELNIYHVEWESGNITKDHITTFSQYETRFLGSAKKKSKLYDLANKAVAFLNGGGR